MVYRVFCLVDRLNCEMLEICELDTVAESGLCPWGGLISRLKLRDKKETGENKEGAGN